MAEKIADVVIEIRAETKQLRKDLANVKTQMKGVEKNTTTTGNSFKKMAGFIGGTAVVGTLLYGYKNLVSESVKLAAQSNQIAGAFDNLTASAGMVSSELLNTLARATNNAVDNMTLMQQANQALLLGIDPEALPTMFEGARAAAAATGRPIASAIADITTGIGRQSKMILDNLGIMVNTQKAYEDYAKTLGKTANALDDVEKKAAFTSATMKALKENAEGINLTGTTQAESIQQLNTLWTEFKDTLGQEVLPAVEDFIDYIKDNKEQLTDLAELLGKVAAGAVQVSIGFSAIMNRKKAMDEAISASEEFGYGSPEHEKAKKRVSFIFENEGVTPEHAFERYKELTGKNIKDYATQFPEYAMLLKDYNDQVAELTRTQEAEEWAAYKTSVAWRVQGETVDATQVKINAMREEYKISAAQLNLFEKEVSDVTDRMDRGNISQAEAIYLIDGIKKQYQGLHPEIQKMVDDFELLAQKTEKATRKFINLKNVLGARRYQDARQAIQTGQEFVGGQQTAQMFGLDLTKNPEYASNISDVKTAYGKDFRFVRPGAGYPGSNDSGQIIVNIDTINGVDATDVATALNEELAVKANTH